ncbi:MAG: hypothetical protein I8H94_05525 [Rhodobacteraceae bacterium]|nr:hypothetical protein [Paracoccaceae bacterium]
MLGLLALFGAVLAGVMVEISPDGNTEEDEESGEEGHATQSGGGTTALIEPETGDTTDGGTIHSDDNTPAPAEHHPL